MSILNGLPKWFLEIQGTMFIFIVTAWAVSGLASTLGIQMSESFSNFVLAFSLITTVLVVSYITLKRSGIFGNNNESQHLLDTRK